MRCAPLTGGGRAGQNGPAWHLVNQQAVSTRGGMHDIRALIRGRTITEIALL